MSFHLQPDRKAGSLETKVVDPNGDALIEADWESTIYRETTIETTGTDKIIVKGQCKRQLCNYITCSVVS